MKLFQKIPAAMKAVYHTSPHAAVSLSKILLKRCCELSNVMQHTGKIRCIFQSDRAQALSRPLRRACQVFPNRLPNNLSVRRFPLVCIICHSCHQLSFFQKAVVLNDFL